MRRDARLRRDALIAAAAECFAERGYSVPLEEVAARAGVGRGTLYRNFRDREALAIAIFEREIDGIDAIVAGAAPFRGTMIDLAVASARGTSLFARIATELVADPTNMAALEALRGRLADALEPLARRSRASGDLRGDIDGAGLGLALRMVGGLFHAPPVEPAAMRRLNDAMDIILHGIGPARSI